MRYYGKEKVPYPPQSASPYTGDARLLGILGKSGRAKGCVMSAEQNKAVLRKYFEDSGTKETWRSSTSLLRLICR